MEKPPSRPEDPEWSPDIGPVKGRSTPPWLWLTVIGLLALIFWQFVPKTEVQVLYYPWFMEQVERDNIKSISFQDREIRGELREKQPYTTPSGTNTPVQKFTTYAPSEDLIKPDIIERVVNTDDHISARAVRFQLWRWLNRTDGNNSPRR